MKSRLWSKWIRIAALILLVTSSLTPVVVAAAPVLQDTEDPDQDDGDGISDFCSATYLHPITDQPHPVASRLSGEDEDLYGQVMDWFCLEGMGFGQIKLALMTEKILGDDDDTDNDGTAEELLDRREEGEGWGQIWLDLGLIGWSRHTHQRNLGGDDVPESDVADEPGRPEHAGPQEDHVPPGQIRKTEDGGGPPEHARSQHNR